MNAQKKIDALRAQIAKLESDLTLAAVEKSQEDRAGKKPRGNNPADYLELEAEGIQKQIALLQAQLAATREKQRQYRELEEV